MQTFSSAGEPYSAFCFSVRRDDSAGEPYKAIKIGSVILLGRGVFVLLISNINGVYQNYLTAPSNVKLNYVNCYKHIN